MADDWSEAPEEEPVIEAQEVVAQKSPLPESGEVGFREVWSRFVGLLGKNNGPLLYLGSRA